MASVLLAAGPGHFAHPPSATDTGFLASSLEKKSAQDIGPANVAIAHARMARCFISLQSNHVRGRGSWSTSCPGSAATDIVHGRCCCGRWISALLPRCRYSPCWASSGLVQLPPLVACHPNTALTPLSGFARAHLNTYSLYTHAFVLFGYEPWRERERDRQTEREEE